MKVHMDERNFHCDICEKKFLDARTLDDHICTHTGEKPFSCDFCDMRFTQASSLRSHIKNKHN